MAATIKASDLIAIFQKAYDEAWGYIWGTAGKEWTEKLQKQKISYMANKYGSSWKTNSEAKEDNYYRAALYGAKWIGYMVADCSGMFVFAYQKYGLRISHSSHYQFTDYCKEKGKLDGKGNRTDGKELKPGTAVFQYNGSRFSHIGLYIGDGYVIEAKGTQQGVVRSKMATGGWDYWGELKSVDYTNQPEVKPEDPEHKDPEKPETRKTLKRGEKGDAVKDLQKQLLALGYPLPKYGADGDFGKETEAAVKAFQQDSGLTADGVVGRKTWEALENAEPMKLYTVTIPGLMKHEAEALVKNYSGASWREE